MLCHPTLLAIVVSPQMQVSTSKNFVPGFIYILIHPASLSGVVFLTPKSLFHVSSWIIYMHAYLHAYVHIQKHRYMFICVRVQFFFLGHGSVIPFKMSKDVIFVTSWNVMLPLFYWWLGGYGERWMLYAVEFVCLASVGPLSPSKQVMKNKWVCLSKKEKKKKRWYE